jgi:cation diffusion facilitator CzcD-associated flavoprotein CzcO
VVIGAGFTGLYALHTLRDLDVVCFEAGDGVGGTWYWNRYPGARVDIESMQYSYSFDDDLQQEWRWPEYFSPQADLEAYANHVADRFGLRARIRFSTRVEGMRFDEATDRWYVSVAGGSSVTARYVIAATGALNARNVPDFPGFERYQGEWHHTSAWPREGVDFTGKRVGVIGTGSTGIQSIPVIAAAADHLTVFQRTPAYTLPAFNRPLDEAHEQDWKTNYPQRRAEMRTNVAASYRTSLVNHGSVFDHTPEERQRLLEQAWSARNGLLFLTTFTDTMTSLEANEVVAEFIRQKIRETVTDPVVAERLSPRTYPVGSKRICMDTGYYETFNRENVELVDLRETPIVEFTEHGIRTSDREHDLDLVVLATGFDGVTGSFLRLDVTGVGGVNLREKWAQRATNYLGLMVAGFPNLFMIHGPGSPGVLSQMISSGEWQVEWVTRLIRDLRERGISRIDTTPEAEQSWGAEMDAMAEHTLYKYADSWYVGANIPGKPRHFMIYIGGFDQYTRRLEQAVQDGYEGFVLTPARAPV